MAEPDASRPATRAAGTIGGLSAFRRLRLALVAYLITVVIGVVGYVVVADAALLEALYMTVITVTTVGFGEIIDLDPTARIFTIFLILAGVGSAVYAGVSAAEFFVEGHFRNMIEGRRMERAIERLDQHVIVCGYGRVGRHVVADLEHESMPFVVVDDDEAKTDELGEAGYLHIRGDATAEQVLESAGLQQARALVACVQTDADNVLLTLTAKGLNPAMFVISRVKADENESKLQRAGADRVIAPSNIGGRRIAQLLTRPAVADFLEEVAGTGGLEYSFEEIPIARGTELDGKTLREAAIRERFRCSVLGVRHAEEGRVDTHPDAETELHDGDVLIVIGGDDDVIAMRDHFTR